MLVCIDGVCLSLVRIDGEWHYIAVTWESRTGTTILYDNTRPVWIVKRGKGKRIPSGGTLVVGREQDCKGGCFDSGKGVSGNVQPGLAALNACMS